MLLVLVVGIGIGVGLDRFALPRAANPSNLDSEIFEQSGPFSAEGGQGETNFPYPYALPPNVKLDYVGRTVAVVEVKTTGFRWRDVGSGSHAAEALAGIALPMPAIAAGDNGSVIHGNVIAAVGGSVGAFASAPVTIGSAAAAHCARSPGAPADCRIGAYDCARRCSASLVIAAAFAT